MVTLVTGASGHIGVNLVREFVKRGRSVRALVHNHGLPPEIEREIEVVHGDICDITSLSGAFRNADVVYHLAARISIAFDKWSVLEKINVAGTRNVVESCLNSGVRRLVHFSSIHAIAPGTPGCVIDESLPRVNSAAHFCYDRSKAAGEAEVLGGIERGLDAVIIIPTGVIGPYDYQLSLFGEALLGMAAGTLPALVSGGFDWVDVRDVVNGAIRAEETAPGGSRYLLSGHRVSVKELGKQIAEITGIQPPRFVTPMWLARLAAPPATWYARLTGKSPLFTSASLQALRSNQNISHEKATRELGYSPRPFHETLVDTLRWYAENGKLKTNRSLFPT